MAFLVSPVTCMLKSPESKRLLLFAGCLIEAASFTAASFATQIWHLFLTQGACFGIGMGLLYIGTVGTLNPWFVKRRGLANSIASAGSGVGGLVYSLATDHLIGTLDFKMTLRVLSILAFSLNALGVMLVREKKAVSTVSSSSVRLMDVLQNPRFILSLVFGMFSILAYVVCLFSLPSYAVSIGLSSLQGSVASALLNVGQIIGRPVIGLLNDKFNRYLVVLSAHVFAALLSLVFWLFTDTFPLLCVFSILLGLVA